VTLGILSKPAVGSPLSLWEPPDPTVVLSASYLVDAIDPLTGEVQSLTTGMDPTDAALLTQLRTVRGSGASVLEDGHNLDRIENNNGDAKARIVFELQRLVQPFLDRREIQLERPIADSVDAGEAEGDTAAAEILYVNLRTREKRSIPVTR